MKDEIVDIIQNILKLIFGLLVLAGVTVVSIIYMGMVFLVSIVTDLVRR